MSIEEIIEGLKEMDKRISAEVLGLPSARECEALAILRGAIALLRTHQDAQPNEPLTLEELMKMDGQPVVVVKGNDDPMWALVTVESVTDKFYEFFINCADGDKLRFDAEGCNNFDGEEVFFYRRPPKEDRNDR